MTNLFSRLRLRFSLAIKRHKERKRIIKQYSYFATYPARRFAVNSEDCLFCYSDNTAETGFDRHYVYHVAWACRILAESCPSEHVDISSSLYFAVAASAFLPVRYYDLRASHLALEGLTCHKADLTRLDFASNSIDSLSCMHVVEHVGLGRYGDCLDYDGDLKAVAELIRVLAVGGQLLFVVPLGGVARIQFNAHRIYTYYSVLDMFQSLELVEFTLIPDDESEGGLVRFADETLASNQKYACGCFLFKKDHG